MIYGNRKEAGKHLAEMLMPYANRADVLVLALPRGGVPVAYEVAKALSAPLDLFLVRKLGLPGQEELAMGAIASGGVRVLNDELVNYLGVPDDVIDFVAKNEKRELDRRERVYRGNRSRLQIKGKTVILVDDGLATGSSMRAAVEALRQQQPKQIVVAVPVSAPQICDKYSIRADEIVCAAMPNPFLGVGRWYKDFSQTTDEEVRELLQRANPEQAGAERGAAHHV